MITEQHSVANAQGTAVLALTFLVGDASTLARFLDVTGWTPATLANADARDAILVAALDYLMREEDLLLTFAANAGIDPVKISKAHKVLSGGNDSSSWQ